jgi:glycosyltransferase involved in cell wall biosynthesis
MKYLDLNRFAPYLIVPETGEFAGEAQKLRVPVFCVGLPRIRSAFFWRSWAGFRQLKEIVRREGIDIIHTEGPRETLYAGLVGKQLGVPVVAHLRVLESQAWIDRVICWCADSIIAVSCAASRRSACLARPDKVRVIYNGVELDRFRPTGTWGHHPKLRVGYFGRIHRRKGIEVLIRAVKELPEVETVIVGDGDRRYREELVLLARGSAISFKPYQADIIEEMNSVDVVVLPSLLVEGFPRVVIEAMAMGKIAIASDHPSCREALGEALQKFIVGVGDAESLAALLGFIYAHADETEGVRSLMRKRAQECFDIKAITKQIESVYEELITRRVCHGRNPGT